MQRPIQIDEMCATDWDHVRHIYLAGIHTGNATFEQGAPSWEEWDARHIPRCRFVARLAGEAATRAVSDASLSASQARALGVATPQHATWDADVDGTVIGWVALSPTSTRRVYAGVAEVSIYVSPDHHGCGVGSLLLRRLIEASEECGFWTLQAGIFPENVASLALHSKFGFRQIGRRERIGQMNGIWRDTVLLERRSKVVGT